MRTEPAAVGPGDHLPPAPALAQGSPAANRIASAFDKPDSIR